MTGVQTCALPISGYLKVLDRLQARAQRFTEKRVVVDDSDENLARFHRIITSMATLRTVFSGKQASFWLRLDSSPMFPMLPPTAAHNETRRFNEVAEEYIDRISLKLNRDYALRSAFKGPSANTKEGGTRMFGTTHVCKTGYVETVGEDMSRTNAILTNSAKINTGILSVI